MIGIVAVVNVINFIDGIDGLAAGVCTIAAIALAVIALSLERNEAGVLAALTAGGALGFLRHGFPPASSFMGDTGSNLLGYLLATASVQGALKTNAVVALILPLVVLAVPILDTGFVVAKRLKYRQPIYQADSWHFHHRMANIGFSQRRTLAYLYGWTLALAGLALALRFVPYSDNHGHFNALWTAVMVAFGLLALATSVYLIYVLEILKLRRGRLNPETGEFEAIEIDARTLVTGCDKGSRIRLRKPISGPSDIVAYPPARPESGGFYVSSQVRRPLRAGRRAGRLCACRSADARASPSAPLPGSRSAGSRSSRSAAPTKRSPTATARRRWALIAASDPRPRLADGHRGPASSASPPNARPASTAAVLVLGLFTLSFAAAGNRPPARARRRGGAR